MTVNGDGADRLLTQPSDSPCRETGMGKMVEIADEQRVVGVDAGGQEVTDLSCSQIGTNYPAGFGEFYIRPGSNRLVQRLIILAGLMKIISN